MSIPENKQQFNKIIFNEFLEKVTKVSNFNCNDGAINIQWFIDTSTKLYNSYCYLQDNFSKNLFLSLIAFRIANSRGVVSNTSFISIDHIDKIFKNIIKDDNNNATFFKDKDISKFNYSFKGQDFTVYGREYISLLEREKYFYSRDDVSILPQEGEYIVDGGGFLGETAVIFSSVVGPNGKVFVFEPVHEHLEVINANCYNHTYKNITILPYGLSDSNNNENQITINKIHASYSVQNNIGPLRTIDYFVEDNTIEKIDYLKLNVVGLELEALKGSINSILRFKPKLAINLHSNRNALFKLILFIKETFPFYKCYLDHYTPTRGETVLYCCID